MEKVASVPAAASTHIARHPRGNRYDPRRRPRRPFVYLHPARRLLALGACHPVIADQHASQPAIRGWHEDRLTLCIPDHPVGSRAGVFEMVHETDHGARHGTSAQPDTNPERQRPPRAVQPDHPGRVCEPPSEKLPHLAERNSRIPDLVQPKKAAPGASRQNADSKNRRNFLFRFRAIDLKTAPRFRPRRRRPISSSASPRMIPAACYGRAIAPLPRHRHAIAA